MNQINGNVKKVVLDAEAEKSVAEVSGKLKQHLDLKCLVCPEETQREIQDFLNSSGYTKTGVRKVDWPKQGEASFYFEFSFDDTIVEHQKITRGNLKYTLEPATF
jgi:hypothetical protein